MPGVFDQRACVRAVAGACRSTLPRFPIRLAGCVISGAGAADWSCWRKVADQRTSKSGTAPRALCRPPWRRHRPKASRTEASESCRSHHHCCRSPTTAWPRRRRRRRLRRPTAWNAARRRVRRKNEPTSQRRRRLSYIHQAYRPYRRPTISKTR